MTAWILIGLFVTHFVADFLLQSHDMAQNKSKDVKVLFKHVAIHFICFLWMGPWFALANMALHAIIDWNIWRFYKRYVHSVYEKMNIQIAKDNTIVDMAHKALKRSGEPALKKSVNPEDHEFWNDGWFYKTIGFDQLLHATCYIALYAVFGFGW